MDRRHVSFPSMASDSLVLLYVRCAHAKLLPVSFYLATSEPSAVHTSGMGKKDHLRDQKDHQWDRQMPWCPVARDRKAGGSGPIVEGLWLQPPAVFLVFGAHWAASLFPSCLKPHWQWLTSGNNAGGDEAATFLTIPAHGMGATSRFTQRQLPWPQGAGVSSFWAFASIVGVWSVIRRQWALRPWSVL